MLIYFDESYDEQHAYLLLGALFNPHPRFLHRKICEIKKENKFYLRNGRFREIKYFYCKNEESLKVSKLAIDAFFESTSWFRCIVIKEMNLSYFGAPYESENIKKARAYKKFAELLLAHNTEKTYMGILLTDRLTRCRGDLFVERMKECFCVPNQNYSMGKPIPTLTRIEEVDSCLDQYQVLQICDLLLGCVTNNLVPPKNKYKKALREYLIKKLGAKDLLPITWDRYSKTYVETYFPKFNIWYFKPSEKEKLRCDSGSTDSQVNPTSPTIP
ncbi:hypothetical protein AUJ66_05995 [Candidatus Desantisbacteria bacterium CG1_02_38_46]|uniref:DUF3800 domain-containing protein n=3 Tax=unclassified Candidatus Desantisiibacteriota TaxID=3106372 RepID=A0A2H9PB48_9BACT|nr:MAG: hypothetical protein AUJ66_05995 [Candidatus Desantisbacteria bacterium CG1_02_38_46]PIU52262.1 MAG: hypothetical protein COS91_00125 [Candidatus Desantisbacteria bacterium CG07_land_8_20_14_0_80_39_15]PIZ15062.1 MAG: hypothetical protein COY51_06510 [Candidatus Desantisbacteria bacterium CG_4_10_14_0_8_um_filter_39_17]